MWSQYLEVAIGPDAEVFTKSPVLSTVGWGAEIGVRIRLDLEQPRARSRAGGRPPRPHVGATLGNDVNLRDFEGRSALLLGKAKDNNASCALGPFIRLFDGTFSIDDVRGETVDLRVQGADGYVMAGTARCANQPRSGRPGPPDDRRAPVSRRLRALPRHAVRADQDRDEPGRGFTHKLGDLVTIRSRASASCATR